MEKSVMSKNTCSAGSIVQNEKYSSEEESSWTFYLEGFLRDNNSEYDQQVNCHNEASSNNNDSSINNDEPSDSDTKKVDKNYKKLSFKKRKTKGAIVDDDLEDTATSPVNSPKLEKGRSGIDGRGDNISEYTELKKRGLCLVPVSCLTKYFH